jgi:hypothetical protein
MEILKTSKELTPQEEYAMTMGANSHKMADAVSQRVEVAAWCLYTDTNSDGELKEILAIKTSEGEVMSTISPTFKEDFFKMYDFFKSKGIEVKAVNVVGGESKAKRAFITCTYAA